MTVTGRTTRVGQANLVPVTVTDSARLRVNGDTRAAPVVVPEEGLHARPAAEFVKKAKSYSSDIRVIKDSMEANAKSSLKLMTLGAKQGDRLVIRAEGEDETEAADALAAMISEG